MSKKISGWSLSGAALDLYAQQIYKEMYIKGRFDSGKMTELEKVIYGFASDRQSEGSVKTKNPVKKL